MTLELGGKSPQIVFAYADPDFAADAIARSILLNATQACVADSGLIADRRILENLAAQPVPDRCDQTENAQTRLCTAHLGPATAMDHGDRSQGRGPRRHRTGRVQGRLWTSPVIARCRPSCPMWRPTTPTNVRQIVGPVLTQQGFGDDDQALALSDHPTYGVCASIFTRDLSRVMRAMRRVQAGTVWINRYGRSRHHIPPIGGYRQSGTN